MWNGADKTFKLNEGTCQTKSQRQASRSEHRIQEGVSVVNRMLSNPHDELLLLVLANHNSGRVHKCFILFGLACLLLTLVIYLK